MTTIILGLSVIGHVKIYIVHRPTFDQSMSIYSIQHMIVYVKFINLINYLGIIIHCVNIHNFIYVEILGLFTSKTHSIGLGYNSSADCFIMGKYWYNCIQLTIH